jgi:hypothetical protein
MSKNVNPVDGMEIVHEFPKAQQDPKNRGLNRYLEEVVGRKRKLDDDISDSPEKTLLDHMRSLSCSQRALELCEIFTIKNGVITRKPNTVTEEIAKELIGIYDIDHYLVLSTKVGWIGMEYCKCGSRIHRNQSYHKKNCENLCQSCYYENISNEDTLITLHSMILSLKYIKKEESTLSNRSLINWDVSPSYYEAIGSIMGHFEKPLRKSDIYRKNPLFSTNKPHVEELEYLLLFLNVLSKSAPKYELGDLQRFVELTTLPLYFLNYYWSRPVLVANLQKRNIRCKVRWLFEWRTDVSSKTDEKMFDNPIEEKLKEFGVHETIPSICGHLSDVSFPGKDWPSLNGVDSVYEDLVCEGKVHIYVDVNSQAQSNFDKLFTCDPHFSSNILHLYCAVPETRTINKRYIIVTPVFRWIEFKNRRVTKNLTIKSEMLCMRVAVAIIED